MECIWRVDSRIVVNSSLHVHDASFLCIDPNDGLMRTHGNGSTIVSVLNCLSSHQCTELRELCQVSMSLPIAGYGLRPGCLQRIVRITMATREALARKLRGVVNLRRRRFVRRSAKPRSQARRHFQGRHCASNMMLMIAIDRWGANMAGSVSAAASLRHRVFRHSRTTIRKRTDHVIYNCDYIVHLVGTRPHYVVHNGWVHSYFSRSRACGRGDSVASGAPRHRIDFEAH